MEQNALTIVVSAHTPIDTRHFAHLFCFFHYTHKFETSLAIAHNVSKYKPLPNKSTLNTYCTIYSANVHKITQ